MTRPPPPHDFRTAVRDWLDNVKQDLAAVREAWTGLGQPGTTGRLTVPIDRPRTPPTPEEHARANSLRIGIAYVFVAGILVRAATAVINRAVPFSILILASALLLWRGLRLIRLSRTGTWVPPKPQGGGSA